MQPHQRSSRPIVLLALLASACAVGAGDSSSADDSPITSVGAPSVATTYDEPSSGETAAVTDEAPDVTAEAGAPTSGSSDSAASLETSITSNETTSTTPETPGTTTDPDPTREDSSYCGDGDPGYSETCDDGNLNATDACTTDCKVASCGDGHVYAGVEECDDLNSSNYDICLNNCTIASCGDGYVWKYDLPQGQEAEQCDEGILNGPCPAACSVTCEYNFPEC
jgi:cysteine-rich repeat protein